MVEGDFNETNGNHAVEYQSRKSVSSRLSANCACTACRKRKLRCDGEQPICLRCRRENVVCEYGLPGGSRATKSWRYTGNTHQRRDSWDTGSAVRSDSATTPPARPRDEGLRTEPDGYFGSSSTFSFISNARYDPAQNRKLPQFQSWPDNVLELVSDHVPDRELSDILVNSYFQNLQPMYPFLHQPSFRATYEELWAKRRRNEKVSRSWVSVFYLVLAIGCEFASLPPGYENIGSLLYNESKSRVFSRVFISGNLETVQALLLMGHYLQSTMELNQCWSVVGLAARIALGVGLHLDPTDWDMDPIEKELRSRTWYGCLSIDRVLALKYGRPPAIRDDETITVPLPEPFVGDDSSQNYDIAAGLRATISLARILEEMRSSHYTPSSLRDPSELLVLTVSIHAKLRHWQNRVVPPKVSPRSQPTDPLLLKQRNVFLERLVRWC